MKDDTEKSIIAIGIIMILIAIVMTIIVICLGLVETGSAISVSVATGDQHHNIATTMSFNGLGEAKGVMILNPKEVKLSEYGHGTGNCASNLLYEVTNGLGFSMFTYDESFISHNRDTSWKYVIDRNEIESTIYSEGR
jgi:hypothetical protein